MKKLLLVLSFMVVIFMSAISSNAMLTKDHIYYIEYISYDRINEQYIINCVDENGDLWVVEWFYGKFDFRFFRMLNRMMVDQWIIASVEDYNNNDFYDDEIIRWEFLDGYENK